MAWYSSVHSCIWDYKEKTIRLLDSLRRFRPSPRLMSAGRLAGLLLTIASLVLVVSQGIPEIALNDWPRFLAGVSITLIAYGVSFGFQSVAWSLLIGSLSQSPMGWRDLEIFAYSNLMRRAPGTIWYLIDRVESYRDRGLSGRLTLAASASEWGLLIISGVGVYLFTYLNQEQLPLLVTATVLLAVSSLLGVLVLRRRAQLRTLSPNSRSATDMRSRLTAAWPEMCVVGIVYSICHILGAVMLYQLAYIISPTSSFLFSEAIRFWAFTVVVSTLGSVIILLNVVLRDLTVVVSLMSFMTPATAITVGALLRVVFAIADVSYSLGLWLVSRAVRLHSEVIQKRD